MVEPTLSCGTHPCNLHTTPQSASKQCTHIICCRPPQGSSCQYLDASIPGARRKAARWKHVVAHQGLLTPGVVHTAAAGCSGKHQRDPRLLASPDHRSCLTRLRAAQAGQALRGAGFGHKPALALGAHCTAPAGRWAVVRRPTVRWAGSCLLALEPGKKRSWSGAADVTMAGHSLPHAQAAWPPACVVRQSHALRLSQLWAPRYFLQTPPTAAAGAALPTCCW